jgi:hypothetical protein
MQEAPVRLLDAATVSNAAADSTGGCNSLLKSFSRRFVVQGFPRTLIQTDC